MTTPAIKMNVNACEAKFGGPYNTQDVLVRSLNMPSVIYQGEEFYRNWSDREYFRERWDKAHVAMKGSKEWHPGVESWAGSVTDEQFMEFLVSLADPKMIETHGPVKGGRLVRFTNVSNGFPCYAVDTFHSRKGMPSLKNRRLKDDGFGGRKTRRVVFNNGMVESCHAEE